MRRYARIPLAILGMVGLVAGAAAHLPPSPIAAPVDRSELGPTFSELDRDSDGVLSREELPADHALSMHFHRYDRDSDLQLSRSEYDLFVESDEADDAVADVDADPPPDDPPLEDPE